MANDSAANDPPSIVKGREKKMPEQWDGEGADENQFSRRTRRGEEKRDAPRTPDRF